MKQRSEDFKKQICSYGKEQDVQIIYGNTTLTNEDINIVSFYYQGRLLKSVMKGVTIDSDVNIPIGTEFVLKYGLFVNGEYEYLNLGTFIVKNSKKQEDTNSYELECYDKLLYSMVDYKALDITYPISIRDYINAICEHLGLQFKNKSDIFPNYDKLIYNELYLDTEGNSLGYTFRDVFDELSQVTASVICIDEEIGQVEIRTIKETGDEIDENFLNDVNVDFGEKFGPINSIVLSRSDADNIYLQDEVSVALNGLCEVKIVDNQIMNWDDRDEYLPDLLEALNGIEYYLNDFSSTGVIYYDLLDRYTVKIGEKQYSCVMFNDEINIEQGLEEIVYTEMPEESETEYTSADKTDRKINQTIFRINKQEQKIQSLITQVGDRTNKQTSITQDIDRIESKVSNTVDITNEVEGINKITLENTMAGELLELHIYGNNTVFKHLLPSDDLLPSNDLLPYGDSKVKITRQETDATGEVIKEESEIIDFGIKDVLRQKGDVSDSFDLVNNQATITRRIGVLEDGTTYVRENPITAELGELKIITTRGNLIIEILNYTAPLKAKYVTVNEYTNIFATTVEMNSAITQMANSIGLEVSQKVGNNEIFARINMFIRGLGDQTDIPDDIPKSVIQFFANSFSWDSDHSSMTEDGILTLRNNTTEPYQYTVNDVITIQNYIEGKQTLSEQLKTLYDYNNDGKVTSEDILLIQEIINGTRTSEKFADAEIVLNPKSPTEFIKMTLGGAVQCRLGLNEIYNYTYRGMNMFLGIYADMNNKYGISLNGETGEVIITNSKAITSTVIDAGKIDAYNVISNTRNKKGQCLHGVDLTHDYLCHWDGAKLQFYVDDTNVGELSDERVKSEISEINEKLFSIVDELGFKQFKLANRNGKISVGVIAQELLALFEKYELNPDDFDFTYNGVFKLTDETIYHFVNYEQLLLLQNVSIRKKLEKQDKKISYIIEKLGIVEEMEEVLNGEYNKLVQE